MIACCLMLNKGGDRTVSVCKLLIFFQRHSIIKGSKNGEKELSFKKEYAATLEEGLSFHEVS